MASGDRRSVEPTTPVLPASGPLRVQPSNPRYVADGNGRAVYLTGSHTWSNFQDNGVVDPPPAFDYAAYLDFLQRHHHNFFRLWTWEEAKWANQIAADYWITPSPYARPGPGVALDGRPRFDLTSFNQAYFDRLRDRVLLAGRRRIYVSVMLFNGWSNEAKKGEFALNNPWRGHPFNRDNNINGIDGDPDRDESGAEVHTLALPAVTALQEAYVRKVVDTVNDLDNVLYEICNECQATPAATAWQNHMVDFIKAYEATRPKQHPVGMTAEWPGGKDADLLGSRADWISPNDDRYLSDPLPGDGAKVVVTDTDHLCGICASRMDRAWVWKSLTRGLNPILMDGYDGEAVGLGAATPTMPYDPTDRVWADIRTNLGYARVWATRIDLGAMAPRGELASSGYCLANPGVEYLVYVPTRVYPNDSWLKRQAKRWLFHAAVTVDLSPVSGTVSVEWFDPATGATVEGKTAQGGAARRFVAPFGEDAVLHLESARDDARTVR